MSDIFISYSRKDSAHAEQLAELLVSAGLTCWIDKRGIEAATSWSGEITKAITECMAFVVMLSPNSIASSNVRKEVSLASERQKKILPLDLEPVELPDDLAYHLAGIQRAPMTNIDAVIRALGKLGLAATQAPSLKLVHETDARKSLMILPFEDLSPTADNAWFADGLATELISALSNVKALRVTDQQTTKEFRKYSGHLTTYAKEMGIRYFIQGSVRKFGDQIKITSALLDIETGDHLWQDSMKGIMDDIFDIQEKVAESVVEGLKVHLASDEKKKLADRGTENVGAYELYMKAGEYSARRTREGIRLGIEQISLAIKLDPNYADALRLKADMLNSFYRIYDRDPNLLTEAEQLATRVLEIKPDLWIAYHSLSDVCRQQDRLQEAEDAAKECVQRAPNSYLSYSILGLFYMRANQPVLAISPFEKVLELRPNDLAAYYNIVLTSDRAHDVARTEKWARLSLPHYERHLRLVPDDEYMRVQYANLLRFAGDSAQAVEALAPLLPKQDLDGASLYNIACLYARLNNSAHAIETLRRSLKAGFRSLEDFRTDPELDGLRELSEFQDLMKTLEAKQNV